MMIYTQRKSKSVLNKKTLAFGFRKVRFPDDTGEFSTTKRVHTRNIFFKEDSVKESIRLKEQKINVDIYIMLNTNMRTSLEAKFGKTLKTTKYTSPSENYIGDSGNASLP